MDQVNSHLAGGVRLLLASISRDTTSASVTARLLFLFAKEPQPGAVKTRLCPPLTPAQAARCQRAFLEDLLLRMKRVAARLVLCATPDHGTPQLQALAAAAGIDLIWQGAGDLGQRMERVLLAAAADDSAGVVIGADCPDVPLNYVRTAFDLLERPGVVLGPSADGGYYLVGCRGVVPAIFNLGSVWGGPEVFARTLDALRNLALEHHQLPPWEDVDDVDGLRRLAARLRKSGATVGAEPVTACDRLIESLAREGVSL